ncbi:hypothetical protein HUJ05_005094 [Dendroctonus ponderosae]|nr:hypothetical protein HUJ05_005094 [Dendroctonus ponderosae]
MKSASTFTVCFIATALCLVAAQQYVPIPIYIPTIVVNQTVPANQSIMALDIGHQVPILPIQAINSPTTPSIIAPLTARTMEPWMGTCLLDRFNCMIDCFLTSRGPWEFLTNVSATTALDIIKGDEAVGEVISRAFRLRLVQLLDPVVHLRDLDHGGGRFSLMFRQHKWLASSAVVSRKAREITSPTASSPLIMSSAVVAETSVYVKEKRWWTYREKIIEYPSALPAGYTRHETISAIRIYNQFLDGNSARATILKGGTGYQYVKIRLESKYNKGFKYLVQIYGH